MIRWRGAEWVTSEQQVCIDTAEPVIRQVLDELAPEHAGLARALAIAGCCGWKSWEFDPDERGKIEHLRRTVEALEREYRQLAPGTRGAVGFPDLEALLGPLKAGVEHALGIWPRYPRHRPPNIETELVFRLWGILSSRKVPMRQGARCIAEIFVRLGTIPTPEDPGRFVETIYQRIRNATLPR